MFTNGPLLVLTSGSTPVGGVKETVTGSPVALDFEWNSNELYGPLNKIEIYKGKDLADTVFVTGSSGSCTWTTEISEPSGSLLYFRAIGFGGTFTTPYGTDEELKCYTNPLWVKATSVTDNPAKEDARCFIATAAFGTSMEPEVVTLKQFRDTVLKKYYLGRLFIESYYRLSPPIARFIAQRPLIRAVVRWILSPVISTIKVVMV